MYEADTFSLSNLNPTYFFHNLNNREIFNSAALFNLEYQIDSGLSVYSNFMVDQLAIAGESSTEPSALGLEIGGKKIFDLDDRLVDLKLEVGFTSPQLYTRDFVDYKMSTRYYTNGTYNPDSKNLYYVNLLNNIGFPYGADSIFAKIESNYYSLKNYTFKASYLMLLKGPTLINAPSKTTDDYNTTIFPQEIKRMKNIVELKGTYNFDTKIPMSIYCDLSFVDNYCWTDKINTFDVQLNLTYSIKI
jgi:hypothetical protein